MAAGGGNLGHIGTAHVDVDLDFERAVREAQSQMSPQLTKAFTAAAGEAATAFGRVIDTEVPAQTAAAAKLATTEFSATMAKGMAAAGAEAGAAAGKSFGATLRTSIAAGAASARTIAAEQLGSLTAVAGAAGASAGRAFGTRMAAAARAPLKLLSSQLVLLTGAFVGLKVAQEGVRDTAELAKSAKALGDNYGFTARQAGRYAAVAKALDVPQQKLALGLTTLSRNAVAAAQGSDKQAKAFQKLNVSQKLLKSGDVNAIFNASIEGLKNMRGGTDKAAIGMSLFGRGFQGLRPLIKGGKEGLKEAGDEAEKFGAVLTDTKAIQKYTKAQHAMHFAMLGVRVQLGQRLIPTLANAATKFTAFLATSKPLHRILRGIGAVIGGVTRGIGGFARSFAKAFAAGQGQKAKPFSVILERLGHRIGDLAAKWLPKLGTAIGKVAGFFSRHTGTFKAFIAIFAAGKIFGIVNLAKTILPLLADALIAVASVIGWPITLVIAFSAALVIAYKKSETFRKIVQAAFAMVRKGIQAAMRFGAAALHVFLGAVKLVAKGVRLYFTPLILFIRLQMAIWRKIFQIAGQVLGWLVGVVRDKVRAIRERFHDMVARVREILHGLDLSKIGERIMHTLAAGLKSGFEAVKNFVKGIAKWIKDHKGPISVDRELLVPAGKAIMGGFLRGLRDKWRPIQHWISTIGGVFKGLVPAPMSLMADVILGTAKVGDLTKWLNSHLGLGGGGASLSGLHPTSGWADTFGQVKLLEKLFHVGMTSGLRSYDTVAGAGVSQHVLGQAADFGTSRGSFSALTGLATFTSRLIDTIFKQVIWQNQLWKHGRPGFGYVPDHMDHVHLGWKPRAAGGQVRKGDRYRWNERGAEIFTPAQNGYVMNASRTRELITALRDLSRRPGRTDNRRSELHVHAAGVDARSVLAIGSANLGSVFSRV